MPLTLDGKVGEILALLFYFKFKEILVGAEKGWYGPFFVEDHSPLCRGWGREVEMAMGKLLEGSVQR